jgi:hypothetical protein
VVLYQVTRGLIASLISKVFGAFLITQVQNRQSKLPLSPTEAYSIMFGQACATVTSYFTSATDIFLALTQIDLTVVGMVSTIIFEGVALQKFLKERVEAYTLNASKSKSLAPLKKPFSLPFHENSYLRL